MMWQKPFLLSQVNILRKTWRWEAGLPETDSAADKSRALELGRAAGQGAKISISSVLQGGTWVFQQVQNIEPKGSTTGDLSRQVYNTKDSNLETWH